MEGKKLVIGMFALAILLSAITFGLYLLTRQIGDEDEDGVLTPNAVVLKYEAPEAQIVLF